jgi:TonB-dependent starch-binding outer membrane protein SusC
MLFRNLTISIILMVHFDSVAQKVTIHEKAIPLSQALDLIRQRGRILLIYSQPELADAPLITIDCKHADVREALDRCFAGLHLGYVVEAGKYSVYRKVGLDASLYKSLQGRVQNAEGEPLDGASVIADGVSRQITRAGGRFGLPGRALRTMVTISFLGYSPRQVCLTNDAFQVVILQPVASTLDNVVVQAYGHTTTRLATGSVVQVKGSEIAGQPEGNILESLEGRVPGLAIRQLNGVPGSAYGVLIRGRQSISQGTDPLVVIDNVPVSANNGYLSLIGSGSAQGSTGASDLNGVPPAAIKSIEVLKGAAATAIYGSRGSNGVLLVTLKTGATGPIKWDVDVYTGADQAVRTSALMNTQQYLALRRQAVENDGLTVNASTVPEQYLWDSTRYTNFKKLTMGNTRQRQNARIELSGGDTNTVYLLSGSYHREAAVFPGVSSDQRMSLYGHLKQQSGNRRLQLNLSLLYSWEDNQLPIQDFTYFGTLAPNSPAFKDSSGQYRWSYNGIPYLNIPALENNRYQASVTNQFNHLEVSYDIWRGLVLRAHLGYYRIGSDEHSVMPIAGQDPASGPTGQTTYTGNTGHSELAEGMAEYTRQAGPGRLQVLAGMNWQQQRTDFSAINASGYTSDLLLNAGAGNPTVTTTANSVVYRYEAGFGRIDYNIDDWYILTLSGSRDGSSRFGPGNQLGNFWAVGGAWIFGDEPFISNLNWMSFGKLRGSIGTTGNDQIGDNSFAEVYTGTGVARGFQGMQGVYPISLANNNLGWEVNYNEELALDLGFLQNKVLLSVTAYRDWTRNQLLYSSLPGQTGAPGVVSNLPADIVNEGLELFLQTYNRISERFRWVSTINLTVPVNRLAAFPGLDRSSYANSLIVGQSLSVIEGYHYERVNPQTGLFQFRQGNHSDTLTVGAGGNLDLRYYGGCEQSLRYKDWQLDLFFEFRVQRGYNPYVVLYQENPPGFQGSDMQSNAYVQWLHRWHQLGNLTQLEKVTESYGSPATAGIYNYISSDAQVTDASFIRWKSMTLSYRLPVRWMRNVTECRLYVEGENLLTYTHFPVTDPETQDPTVLPPVRTLVAGINLKF